MRIGGRWQVRVVAHEGRKCERFRPSQCCQKEALFDKRRAVSDLVAWSAMGYGAHGWHGVVADCSDRSNAECLSND
jgi:hypothetical protein